MFLRMEEKKYKITLADGTVLTNLSRNGSNYISKVPIEKDVFECNCSLVLIDDGEEIVKYDNMELVHVTKYNEEYWFAFRDIPDSEWNLRKMKSDIEYIAMMTDVDL